MATISISTAGQKNEFLARLSRIEAGVGSSKSTLYVGLDETYQVDSKASAKLKKGIEKQPAKPLGIFGMVLSAGLGAVALVVALYLRFAITGEAGPLGNTDAAMVTNGGIGLAVAFFSGYMLKMPMLKFVPISAVGVLAGLVSFHNLVHIYPSQFANVFSPTWVDQVVSATEANTIIWRGETFVL